MEIPPPLPNEEMTFSEFPRSRIVEVKFEERYLNVYVPSNTNGKIPMVVELHGQFTDPSFLYHLGSHMDELAEEHGFVAVWPKGVGKSWNPGALCCGEKGLANPGTPDRKSTRLNSSHRT